MLDVVVSYDTPSGMEAAFHRKVDKYMTLGNIRPLVVGSLGSLYPRKDEIRSLLNIIGRSCCAFKRKARIAAIQGSMLMIPNLLASAPADDRGLRQEDPVSQAGSILAVSIPAHTQPALLASLLDLSFSFSISFSLSISSSFSYVYFISCFAL